MSTAKVTVTATATATATAEISTPYVGGRLTLGAIRCLVNEAASHGMFPTRKVALSRDGGSGVTRMWITVREEIDNV